MKRLRVYLSSTFEDLEDYRAAAFAALEKAGLDVARMEAYTAADERPLDLCLRDVAQSDIYVGLFAWRYGYEPPAEHGNPLAKSITELEFRQAQNGKLRTLLFFANPDTKVIWPERFNDERTGEGQRGKKLNTFRNELTTEKSASFFRTPDELATLVLAAIMRSGLAGRPFNAPPRPFGFVRRSGLTEALLQSLVAADGTPGTNTVVQAAGGFGKTTLAIDACHLPEVVKAFPDGILWTVLGQKPDLARTLSDLYASATGSAPAVAGVDAVGRELATKLEGRRCLVVVDDAWRGEDLQHFLYLKGPRLLVTTRIRNLVEQAGSTGWPEVTVDEMEAEEAASLLGRGLPLDDATKATLRRLADRLGCFPLLLELANARLLEEHKTRRGNVADCIDRVTQLFERRGVLGFDRRDSTARNAAVAKSVEVGLELADEMVPGLAEKAAEISIFPEDVPIPVRALADLWAMDLLDVEEEVVRPLDNLSNLSWDRETGEIRLHDMIRRALDGRLAKPAAVHRKLVDAWGDPCRLPHEYAWRWLTYHLAAGERMAELRALLCDFAWLNGKLEATEICALTSDYGDNLSPNDPLSLVQDALRLASSYLAADKAQLASQLVGRLRPGASPDVDALLAAAKGWRGKPWLRPLHPTLRAPGGPLVRVFRGYAGGHRGTVRSIVISGTGHWAVSAGNSTGDQCVIVWNLTTGTHRRLEQQAEADGNKTPLAITDDGDLFVSAFGDELRVWRVADAVSLMTLRSSDARITAAAIADDGKCLVAGAADGSVVRWNLETRAATTLGRHQAKVEAIAITPAGSWAVSINESEAILWDVTAACRSKQWPTPGFSPIVFAECLAISGDGRSVAWGGYPGGERSPDPDGATGRRLHSIMKWNGAAGAEEVMASHPAATGVLCLSTEGRRALVTRRDAEQGLEEGGVALLVVEEPPRFIELTDVGRGVSSAAISRDGRWGISADFEHDLMLWDLDRAASQVGAVAGGESAWQGRPFDFDAFADGGRYAVFGVDTARPLVWDVAAGAPLPRTRHAASVVRAVRDARAKKGTKKDHEPSEPSAPERGHAAAIQAHATAPHRRWDATASEDGTVRVWDLVEKRPLAVFSDETILYHCIWADDGLTLAVTDWRGKTHLLRLEGTQPLEPQRQSQPAVRPTAASHRTRADMRRQKPKPKTRRPNPQSTR